MHFNFPFTLVHVLWTLTFAAQLVLLVVLIGRERISRYPWFSIGIALFAFRLLVEMLLTGRMSAFPLQMIFISLAGLAALASVLVVVEVARRAFDEAPRNLLIGGFIALLVVAGALMALYSPWPAFKDLKLESPLAVLRLTQIAVQKIDMLADLLVLQLGVLVVVYGRRFKAGWRSHTQSIAIGLSVVALSWLAVQAIWLHIAKNAHPATREEYDHIVAIGTALVNANKGVYIAALIWWIVWLWFDEPGAATTATLPAEPVILPPDENV
jgi:hypothetical protein